MDKENIMIPWHEKFTQADLHKIMDKMRNDIDKGAGWNTSLDLNEFCYIVDLLEQNSQTVEEFLFSEIEMG
jgi:hypothetical protein